MSEVDGNGLGKAASAYLRSARHQPIQWNEWGAEAFAKAAAEDKPVLLDIGAVWCHWCHVMDRESYESAATAKIINEHYIPVKVDRDERPDVDTRYQAAVAAISGQGGWPLTAFLTPDGRPFFGGTYFPPEDRYGRPGFPRVLLTMAEAFRTKRDEVNESASSVIAAIEHSESFSGHAGELGPELVEKLVGAAVKQFDGRNGGFGSEPKFPHSGAIELLLDAASRPGTESARARLVAEVTLRKMAQGGICDQLAGGFHRYSVDERWIVPHFEKLAYDNSELLKNYVHAFQSFHEPQFARVAKEILRWMEECLSDRENGGFYASQDADDSLDDDGDYFTWTRDEAKAVLTAEEFAVASKVLNIRELGDMHHNSAKNVLHVVERPGAGEEEVLERAKGKLYAARLVRKTPFVDKTMYTGWNAMCISAYLVAGRGLGAAAETAFAVKSLERVLDSAWDQNVGLWHVVAYGDSVVPRDRVAGVLEDYAFLGNACLDAWEATGELRYYMVGKALTDTMVARFYDAVDGGFFDTEQGVGAAAAIGALGARRKPLQDAPVPAGNPVAATLLLRLEALSGDREYGVKAEETLKVFAGIVEHFGLYAASYGLALALAVRGPVQVCVVGEDAVAKELEAIALGGFVVNKSVVRLRREQLDMLPPALAQTLHGLPEAEDSFAVVCREKSCLPPLRDGDALATALQGLGPRLWV